MLVFCVTGPAFFAADCFGPVFSPQRIYDRKMAVRKCLFRLCAALFFAGAVFAAADARAQLITVYDTTTPNVVSVSSDAHIIYKATTAGTMTAIIRARATGIIADPDNPAARPLLVRATSFASITVRGLNSCSIGGGCDAFGLEDANSAAARLASLIAMGARTVTMFAASGANVNEQVGGGGANHLLLYHLATANRPLHISVFVAAGASVDWEDSDGGTPLYHAVRGDVTAAVTILLSAGADVGVAADNNDEAPLHFAALNNSTVMLTILLSAGADIDGAAVNGWNALHYAVVGRSAAAISVLVAEGASVNAADTQQRTPLDLAISFLRSGMITVLRANGGRCNFPNVNCP